MISVLLFLYNLAWSMAIPFLRRFPRIAEGYQQRLGRDLPAGPFDIWIQAASGGEAQLTCLVMTDIAEILPEGEVIRVLATSGTSQGVESLKKLQKTLPSQYQVHLQVRYFPFDAPHVMAKAFSTISPEMAVIVETELWPGFLTQAQKRSIPVLLINGRMSEKSYKSYKHMGWFFRKYGPEKSWAISEPDRQRFGCVMAPDSVGLMNNIKFDRIRPAERTGKDNNIRNILAPGSPFVLLGSIRREEEGKILQTIERVLARQSIITIGLFPKHLERCPFWRKVLQERDIKVQLRSETVHPVAPGTVIVWDVFGELAGAYDLAHCTFVGGSLEILGGQNFLEPLVFGLKPIIGPHWKNFAWVGREIVEAGLVKEVQDEQELATALLQELQSSQDKPATMKEVETFFVSRKGGSRHMSMEIVQTLHNKKGTTNG